MLNSKETEIVNDLIATTPRVLYKKIKHRYPEIFEKIQNNIGEEFSERLWLLLHDNIIPTCPECGTNLHFRTIVSGYTTFCSQDCKKKSSLVLDKMKATCIEKYGVDNIFKSKEFIEKNKVLNAGNSPEARLKCANTKLERHGSKTYNNRQLCKDTKIARYGDAKYCNKDKIIQTNQEKYGKNSFTSTQEGKAQVSSTIFKKYGYSNILKVPEIKDKVKTTLSEKYGVINPGLIPGHKEKVSKKNKSTFYDKMINSSRLKDLVTPLFAKEEYNGVKKEHLYKCNKCNLEFLSDMNNGSIPRCPTCNPIKSISSTGEAEVFSYISQELNMSNIIQNDRKILSGKELDVYLPDYNVAIEYHGLYWHSVIAGGKSSKYHLDKTIECENQGIHLIQIFEDEWFNKQDIIKSKIRNILNKNNDVKIHARKCVVKAIDVQLKNDFLFNYHIQGEDRSTYKYGLFYNNELVSVMTFGNLKNKSITGVYELSRFASKYNVSGAAGKLLSHFIKTHKPNKIVSYADRRFTDINKNVYLSLNFTKVSDGLPNYWYLSKYSNRIHRFNYRKSTLNKKLDIYDPILTEWQNMQLNGFDKIYDCGSLKYELTCDNQH